MANENLVTGPNLGSEFDIGIQQANKITLNLGSGLIKNVSGDLVVMLATTTINIPVNYVSISVGANAATLGEDGLVSATATVTNGSGNNFGNGNRYTLTFPSHPSGADYRVSIQPNGGVGGSVPNGLSPHIIAKTSTSITYGLLSGDDGQGLDELDRLPHDVIITGGVVSAISGVSTI